MAMSLGRLNGKVVVLGGGVSGLAAAWRLCSRIDPSRIVLLEAKDTAGGWIRTETTPNGGRFELGPRSVRPHGKAGISTLDLVRVISTYFLCRHLFSTQLTFLLKHDYYFFFKLNCR